MARGRAIVFKRRGARTAGRQKANWVTAGWKSRYRVVEPDERFHAAGADYAPCVLADLSMEGAGLELVDGEVAVGDRVELDLPLGEGRAPTIRLQGDVRHASAGDGGTPRAGLEFVDVGDLERALLYRVVRDLGKATARTA
jgi:hypothetical protein